MIRKIIANITLPLALAEISSSWFSLRYFYSITSHPFHSPSWTLKKALVNLLNCYEALLNRKSPQFVGCFFLTCDDLHSLLHFRKFFKVLRFRGVQCKDPFWQTGGSEPPHRRTTGSTPQRHARVLHEHLPASWVNKGELTFLQVIIIQGNNTRNKCYNKRCCL